MPAGLPPTPWLNPPDYTGSFLKGAQIGVAAAEAQQRTAQAAQQHAAEIGLAQQKLQQQAAQTQAELDSAQQIANQKAMQEQQRLEISKQVHLTQVGLQQQKLEEQKAMNNAKLQQFAHQAAIRAQIQQRIANKEDPNKVYMELGPEAGLSGMGQMVNRASVSEHPQTETVGGHTYLKGGSGWVNVPEGRTQPEGAMTQQERARVEVIKKELPELIKKVSMYSNAKTPQAQKIYDEAKSQLDNYRRQINELTGGAPSESEAAPEKAAPKMRYVPGVGIVPSAPQTEEETPTPESLMPATEE